MRYHTPSMRQRVWSGVFWLIGFCAGVAALPWPFAIQGVAQFRWVLGLFSLWCFALSGYLSGFWAALAQVWFNNDDDDFHAV